MKMNFEELETVYGQWEGSGYEVCVMLLEDDFGDLYVTMKFEEDWEYHKKWMEEAGYSEEDIESSHEHFLETEKYCNDYGCRWVSCVDEADSLLKEEIADEYFKYQPGEYYWDY